MAGIHHRFPHVLQSSWDSRTQQRNPVFELRYEARTKTRSQELLRDWETGQFVDAQESEGPEFGKFDGGDS